jgi:hypothetical protein
MFSNNKVRLFYELTFNYKLVGVGKWDMLDFKKMSKGSFESNVFLLIVDDQRDRNIDKGPT